MPHAPIHRRQRQKNLMLLGILIAVVLVFFTMTVVKLGGKNTPSGAGNISTLAQ